MALGGGGSTHHLFPRSCPLSQVREAPETPTFHFSYTSAGVQTMPWGPHPRHWLPSHLLPESKP